MAMPNMTSPTSGFRYVEVKDEQQVKDLRYVELNTTLTEYYYSTGHSDSSCTSDPTSVVVRPIFRNCTAAPDGTGFYRIDEVSATVIIPKLCKDAECKDCRTGEDKQIQALEVPKFNLTTCQSAGMLAGNGFWYKGEIRKVGGGDTMGTEAGKSSVGRVTTGGLGFVGAGLLSLLAL
ncbi:hypothetical protein HK097_003188 [Rhizophlyctis rosea]|uniref:Uncharacterized protein n=1 Tax=Rhizophlyctis rosea TaxID=64517 RepID=A0AAD5S550_9FUNG|nr:hypothetical protein HK097_003188 [Rhizophlyctis rosea]